MSSVDVDAVGLGDEIMYQPYFVCVKKENDATVIEYGKTQGTTEHGEIFLSMIDKEKPLHVRFYAFGNGEDALEVTDAHVLKRSLTKAKCKGDTEKNEETNICVQKCNGMCDPLKGICLICWNLVMLSFLNSYGCVCILDDHSFECHLNRNERSACGNSCLRTRFKPKLPFRYCFSNIHNLKMLLSAVHEYLLHIKCIQSHENITSCRLQKPRRLVTIKSTTTQLSPSTSGLPMKR